MRTSLSRQFQQALRQASGRDTSIVTDGASGCSSRRNFLRTAAGAAAVTALPGCQSGRGIADVKRVAVVGGGIAGLNAAWTLKKEGVDATIYEAGARLGGRIHSEKGVAGPDLTVELGGEFINRGHEDMLALVEEFGLELWDRSIVETEFPSSVIYAEGRRLEDEELVRGLGPIAEQISADADALDEDWDAHAENLDGMSVKDYLDLHQDKISEDWVYPLMGAVMRSENGRELGEQSALQLIWLLPTVEDDAVELLGESDETFSVVGGNGKIIQALAERMEKQIRRGHRLQALNLLVDGSYELDFGTRRETADVVVLALPFMVLRDVEMNVELPEGLTRFMNEVNLGVNGKLICGYDKQAWKREDGFNEELWTDAAFDLVWDGAQGQGDGAGALTFYPGGLRAMAASEGAATEVAELFNQLLERQTPGISEFRNKHLVRKFWNKAPLTRGGYTSFAPGQYTEFAGEFMYIESEDEEEAQDVVVDRLVFAGEHVSDEHYGFMNGGAQTGRLAAQAVLGLLDPSAEEETEGAAEVEST